MERDRIPAAAVWPKSLFQISIHAFDGSNAASISDDQAKSFLSLIHAFDGSNAASISDDQAKSFLSLIHAFDGSNAASISDDQALGGNHRRAAP